MAANIDWSMARLQPVTPSDTATLSFNFSAGLLIQFTGAPGVLALEMQGLGLPGIPLTITSTHPNFFFATTKVLKVLATGTSGVTVYQVFGN